MNSNINVFLNELSQLFYFEMNAETSGCLYGSAATENWVAVRSDLDLLILVPEEKLELIGRQVAIWHSNPKNPLLDGFVLFLSNNIPMVKRFDNFGERARPASTVLLIDLWNIKYKSKHLFGQDLKSFIREISEVELKAWAIKEIREYWVPMFSDLLSRSSASSDAKISLKPAIWTASCVARLLMLSEGIICHSKLEALHWLANKSSESKAMINLFIQEYEKPDDVAMTFTFQQTFELGTGYLKLLRKV